jgi:hypothetical protein
MLPLWSWDNQRMDERQHPGDRACHITGGCPDALARQGPHLGFAMCNWRRVRYVPLTDSAGSLAEPLVRAAVKIQRKRHVAGLIHGARN